MMFNVETTTKYLKNPDTILKLRQLGWKLSVGKTLAHVENIPNIDIDDLISLLTLVDDFGKLSIVKDSNGTYTLILCDLHTF